MADAHESEGAELPREPALPARPAADEAAATGPRRALALRYDRDAMAAPEVVAKGGGEVAERILALAREHGVPVREDRDLLELLAACDVGDEVPPELYVAVAEVLAFLYRMNGELAGDAAGAR